MTLDESTADSDVIRRVARRIRDLRTQRGMSKEALACAVHCNLDTVRHWELGTHTPSLATLALIAEALGCSIGDLADPRGPR
jgi:transcriptional regulator with XRE-family HTH domain